MTSFELLRLLKFIKSKHFIYIFIHCPPKIASFDEKIIKYFASNHGIITGIKIKLCK